MTKPEKLEAPKPKLPKLASDADAIAELARLGDAERRLAARKAKLAAEQQRAALVYAMEIATLEAECDARVESLRIYCEAHRDRLTAGSDRKHVKFSTGAVYWRDRPAKVSHRGIKEAELVAHILDKTDLAEKFLRTTYELDKDAMRRQPALAMTLPKVKIGSAGEDFYAEPIGAGQHAEVQP